MDKILGRTGKFPRGKINNNDEGELLIAIGTDKDKVIIEFGDPVKWMGMYSEQAIAMAETLLECAIQARKYQ